jgi:hypothetical protein
MSRLYNLFPVPKPALEQRRYFSPDSFKNGGRISRTVYHPEPLWLRLCDGPVSLTHFAMKIERLPVDSGFLIPGRDFAIS